MAGNLGVVLTYLLFAVMVVWLHFVGDFVLQSDYVARNKSISIMVLIEHIMIYSTPFACMIYFFGVPGLLWVVFNVLVHGIVDFFTSKMSRKLYQQGKMHEFFVVVGADQALHMTCLLVSLYILMGY